MALIDDIKTRFPMIDETTIDTYFPLYEDNYKCYYNAEYGDSDCDDEIILNLLAHLIVSADTATTTGGMPNLMAQSESVDGVSTSYAGMQLISLQDSFFFSTIYGQTYMMLISKNTGAYFV